MATDLLGPALTVFLGYAEDALVPAVGRASLYPGAELAWDDCCEGQVWVRVISILPSPLANPGSFTQPCGVLSWVATLGIGVLRCAAVLDDNGNAPTPAELSADTLAMTRDAAALEAAIQCQIGPQVEQLSFLRWEPLGPQGGCVGGEWVIMVKLPTCSCP